MSETKWKYHPKNPANQEFNINGKRCQSKKNGWWLKGHNNPTKSLRKSDT